MNLIGADVLDADCADYARRIIGSHPVVAMIRDSLNANVAHHPAAHRVFARRQFRACVVLPIPFRDEAIHADGEILLCGLRVQRPDELLPSVVNTDTQRSIHRWRNKGNAYAIRRNPGRSRRGCGGFVLGKNS